MQNHSDPRHNSRVIALQRLFQREFKNRHLKDDNIDAFTQKAIKEIDELEKYDSELTAKLLKNIDAKIEIIDAIIIRVAPEWPINNIAVIDLLILRLALLEGFILKITPPKVVINEAIELAKEFSNEQTRRFVSGVLGNIYLNQNKYLKNVKSN